VSERVDELLEGVARDEAAVRLAVESIARGADLRQWDLVRGAFAAEVELDYGTPERLSSSAIVDRWRPLFAGFDATRHEVTDVMPNVTGTAATATSRFRAVHLIRGAPGGDVWTLTGRYEHTLALTPNGWVVTRMRMIPESSEGNGALPQVAMSRGAAV
jgi:hypothetical protein